MPQTDDVHSIIQIDENNPIEEAYELLYNCNDRERAYQLAIEAERRLDAWRNKEEGLDISGEIFAIRKAQRGYLIIAMVYLWKNKLEDARRVDERYMHDKSSWNGLQKFIRPYLEMLLAKHKKDYLALIFSNADFRTMFIEHYEAYMQEFVDRDFPLTRIREVASINSRIYKSRVRYM